MKKPPFQLSQLSFRGLIIVVILVVLSFFGGVFYQKNSSSFPSSPTYLTPPTSPKLLVTGITDGDTLKLADGKVIRLYGVGAPEINEPLFKEATEFTKSMVLNKEITLDQEEKYKEDKFGRLLGYVFVDGKNLNVELVRNGLAKVVLYEKRAKIKYQDELLEAEKDAKAKRIGVWKK